jgi:hypothetical protein
VISKEAVEVVEAEVEEALVIEEEVAVAVEAVEEAEEVHFKLIF